MAERPPQAVQETWRAWVSGTLGGTPAQMEAATEAAIAAVAVHAPQDVIVQVAEKAWRGEPFELPRSHTPKSSAARPVTVPTPPAHQYSSPVAGGPYLSASAQPGPGWVRGRVNGFQPRQELRGRRYVTIWSFRVEQPGGLPPVALEMRGYSFEGSITNGDEVAVKAVSGRHRPQRVLSLENLSSNSTVRVTHKPASALAGLLVLLALVALAVAVANILLPASQLPTWMPGYTEGEGDFHDINIAVPFLALGIVLFILSRAANRFAR